MIFTLFLLCAFHVQNQCVVETVPYAGLAACPFAAADASCRTVCYDTCKLEANADNQQTCEDNLVCFDGATTHEYFATSAICTAADPTGANRVDCVEPCYDYCEANGGAEKTNPPCKAGIPCYDTAALETKNGVAACSTFCGISAKKSVTGTVCQTALPCLHASGGTKDVTDSCTAVDDGLDCLDICATGCLTTEDGTELAACLTAVKCTDVSTGVKVQACLDYCDAKEDLSTPMDTLCKAKLPCLKGSTVATAACAAAGTNNDCIDACLAHCSDPDVYAVSGEKTKCDTAIPCFDVDTDAKVANCKTYCDANVAKSLSLQAGCADGFPCDVNLGADVCGLYLAPGEGDGCTEAQCTAWCVTGKPGQVTNNVNCTTGKTTCTTAPCDNVAIANSQTGCKLSFCEDFCLKDTEGTSQTPCERELPCWNGASSVHGPIATIAACDNVLDSSDVGCTPNCIDFCKVKANYDAAGNKAKCDGVVPCFDVSTDPLIHTCGGFCTGKLGAIEDFCDAQLACTAEFGTGACDDFMYKGESGCTFAQCDAFCKFAGHSNDGACATDKPGKCNTEPCKHKIPANTAPDNTNYCHPDLCTAFCASDPCSTAKSTDCATECTTWCADAANAESELCPEGEGSSFSIVLSLFVLLIALL